ncbi:hypothetical protein VNO78_04511 [Psophocarpus tetragonolobus]|uniref:TMV resistance protein N n=1 Tax=Psophocarpus tetragonolobus TaxID=3891 RepID=A0AAN9T214_PSOTE
MLSKTISKGLRTNDSSGFSLPGDNYPYWLAYIGQGHSTHLQWPEERSDCCMKAMALCVVYSSTCKIMPADCLTSVLIVNYTKCTFQMYKRDTITSFNDEDWQGIISNLKPNDNVEIFVALGHGLTVLKTGIYLIYGQPHAMKMEQPLKVDVQLSPNVIMDEVSSSMKTDTSHNVKMMPLPNLKSEPSTKPKKNIFARLAKGMEQFSCFKGKRDFNKS